MKRTFHHFSLWEDFLDGLYRQSPGDCREWIIKRAARLLSDVRALLFYMRRVTAEWKHASEVNLSNRSRNRQAWLGQAACSMAVGANEDMTKDAWHLLSYAEQTAANEVADKVIAEWEAAYAKA